MKHLIFVDVETTGLNEKAPGAHILELALVAVELPTFKEVAAASWLVLPPCWPTVKRNLHEKVLEMHTTSGLIAELDALSGDNTGVSPREVEAAAVAFVQQWAPKTLGWHTPLAGANPSFDRGWLAAHMSKLAARFHYRHFEVRTITMLQEWILGEAFEASPHRALDDCFKAIGDTRRFLGLA